MSEIDDLTKVLIDDMSATNDELREVVAAFEHRSWRCFHCDEVFPTLDAAREHFGPHELADPACQIDIAKFREMETYFARCCAEDSDSERKFHALRSDHSQALMREEEKGFERGLKAQLEKIPHDKECPYCERAAPPAPRERSEHGTEEQDDGK